MNYILLLGIVLEMIFNAILPFDTSNQVILITPSVYFIILIITQRNEFIFKNFLNTIVYTFIYCFVFDQNYLMTTIIYLVILFVSKIWSRNILDSILEITILSMTTVFVKEIALHLVNYFQYQRKVNIQNVIVYQITPTLIFALIFTIIFVVLYRYYLDYVKIKEAIGKKKEKIYIIDYFKK